MLPKPQQRWAKPHPHWLLRNRPGLSGPPVRSGNACHSRHSKDRCTAPCLRMRSRQGPPRGARGAARPAPATTAPAAPPPQARPGPRRHCPRHRTRPGCRSPRTHLACWRLAHATLVLLLSPQSSSRRDRRRAPPARPSARRPGCSVAGRRCVEQTRRWRPAGTRQQNDVSAGRGTVRMRLLSQQAAPDTAAGG